MHPSILNFAAKYASRISGEVLEVGSLNVNGTLRDVLPITIGTDMRQGPCVDRVVSAEDLLRDFLPESFDAVVSSDALEHIQHWKEAMQSMWAVLKPGGVFLLTMASPSKGRHAYPDDYWRMDMPMFLSMFKDNEVLGHFSGHPSMGACVVKSGPLHLDLNPYEVP